MDNTRDLSPAEEKKQQLYNRASKQFIKAIEDLKDEMKRCVLLYERIRELAVKENFTPSETRQLITIVCSKVELSPYYTRKFQAMVYPVVPTIGGTKLANKLNDPAGILADTSTVEDSQVIYVKFADVSKKDWMSVLRLSSEGFFIRLTPERKIDNIKAEFEQEWANPEEGMIEILP